jgi:hypothetical protein
VCVCICVDEWRLDLMLGEQRIWVNGFMDRCVCVYIYIYYDMTPKSRNSEVKIDVHC